MRLDTRERPERRPIRVLFDGEDVTPRCFMADDEQGEVGLYKRNADGAFYVDLETFDVAQEFVRGEVAIIIPVQAGL